MITITPSILANVFLLSLAAGLGTGIGGLIAIVRSPGRRAFGFLMGITAGVMITLAFLELVNEAWEQAGFVTATIGFAAGAFFMFLLDFLAPHIRFGEAEIRSREPLSPSEPLSAGEPLPCPDADDLPPRGRGRWGQRGPGGGRMGRIADGPLHAGRGTAQPLGRGWHRRLHQGFSRRIFLRSNITDRRLLKTGLLLAIGITVHNIPEGIAVGAGYVHAPDFGLFIASAILLHNIPEGIATALPLCKCGMNRWDAFRAALFSGMAEPVGALLAATFLSSFTNFVPGALAFAGGVMMFITLDELVPTAREHGHQHTTALGFIFGAIFVFLLSGIFGV